MFEQIARRLDLLDMIDWYRRCLEDVQDGRVVRGLAEAKGGYDRALAELQRREHAAIVFARTALGAARRDQQGDQMTVLGQSVVAVRLSADQIKLLREIGPVGADYARSLADVTGLTINQVWHHLDRLEHHGLIAGAKVDERNTGGRVRIYWHLTEEGQAVLLEPTTDGGDHA